MWEAEAVRDEVRAYLVAPLGEPPVVWVLDATGLRKQGQHAVGVARHESGTAGRMEHCHRGVWLASARRPSPARLAGALSLPPAWTHDRERGERAGVPEKHPGATTPQGARQMHPRAGDAREPAAWVTGASVEGNDRRRRGWWEEQDHASGLAVSGNASVWRAGQPPQVKAIRAPRAAAGGCRLRAGHGAKGPRWADGRRWLLGRRRRSAPPALTASVVLAPHAPPLATVVHVAGSRWPRAQGVEEAQGEVGRAQ
jgi:SRSO17 transposase